MIFVAFGASISRHRYNVPVVGFDGTQSRHSKYKVVIFSLAGQDKKVKMSRWSRRSCMLKTRKHSVFSHCIEAVIDLVNVAAMCDRGHIRGAVKPIWLKTGIRSEFTFVQSS